MDPSFLLTAFMTSAHAVPDEHRQWIQDTAAGDWFVVAHLAFFFLLLACFGWATWGIWRRTTRPSPHVQLLMELAGEKDGGAALAEERQPVTGGVEVLPWEKPEDWWKKE
jgi:hypothetical protein